MKFFCIIVCTILISCAPQEVHLHDRHSLSYDLVKSYAKNHPGTTLVLLDYHHDVSPIGKIPLSSNWVAMLLHENIVSRVVWVSGRDLLLPNKNARIVWLNRKLASFSPSDAVSIENRIILTDWHELEKQRIKGPLVVSLDFDIFCHDPGTPPERFLEEICVWMGKQSPGLVTVALSAAYENDASSAWQRLQRFVEDYKHKARNSVWYLEAGARAAVPEGGEESTAWQVWEKQNERFGRRNEGFLPGASVWMVSPPSLRSSLKKINIKPGDSTARDIISGWNDDDFVTLEQLFPQSVTDKALAAAAAAVEDYWLDKRQPQIETGKNEIGIALRIQGAHGDRGCLALYHGVSSLDAAARYCAQLAADDPRYPALLPSERSDLFLELSVFGPWYDMCDPLDFRPGLDSLILKNGNEVTLLQASIAAQRGYEQEDFLARLSNKASLGLMGWKNPGIKFMRSPTIWSRRAMTFIEEMPDYQKNEKK